MDKALNPLVLARPASPGEKARRERLYAKELRRRSATNAAETLSAAPAQVLLLDVEAGAPRRVSVDVRSLSRGTPLTVRVEVPSSSSSASKSGAVTLPAEAPRFLVCPYGLNKRLDLVFAPHGRDFVGFEGIVRLVPVDSAAHSSHKTAATAATAPERVLEIPLIARPPEASIDLLSTSSYLDLGTVLLNQTVVKPLRLRNHGTRAGAFDFAVHLTHPEDHGTLRVALEAPASAAARGAGSGPITAAGSLAATAAASASSHASSSSSGAKWLEAGETATLSVRLDAQGTGAFEARVRVTTVATGHTSEARVVATAVSQALQIELVPPPGAAAGAAGASGAAGGGGGGKATHRAGAGVADVGEVGGRAGSPSAGRPAPPSSAASAAAAVSRTTTPAATTAATTTSAATFASSSAPPPAVDFGTLFFGETRTVHARLRNLGPHASSFTVVVESRSEDDGLLAHFQEMRVTPAMGTVEAFSSTALQLTFLPEEIDREFERLVLGHLVKSASPALIFAPQREYRRIAALSVVETGQVLEVALHARAVRVEVAADRAQFAFAATPIGGSRAAMLRLTNRCEELAVPWALPHKIAQFHAEPGAGRLAPGETAAVTLSFRPKQMGRFRSAVPIDFANGLKQIHLQLSGTAAVSAAGVPAGALAADATLTLPSVKGDQPRPRDPTEPWAPTARWRVPVVPPGDDDRGLEPPRLTAGGAATPPILDDSYFRRYQAMLEKVQRAEARKMKALKAQSDSYFAHRRFKPKPSTQQEVRECKMKLSRGDLFQNVTAGNKMFDFESVCVHSTNTKAFNITNENATHILVALQVEAAELRGSNPRSQVIPPGKTASFNIVFKSAIPQTFYSTISYTVNSVHTYIITVSAEVTPITLELSKDRVNFALRAEQWSQARATELVSLTNPHPQRTEFKCVSADHFHVKPDAGVIPANGAVDLRVAFAPDHRLAYKESIAVKVNGGPDCVLRCLAKVPKVAVDVQPATLDFEVVAVLLSATRTFALPNAASADAYFEIESTGIGGAELHIHPRSGCIKAQSRVEIAAVLTPSRKQVYDATCTITVPGQKPLAVRLRARADIPTVNVDRALYDFEGVYVGATRVLPVTLHNTSTIPACIRVDLSAHRSFSVRVDSDEDDDDPQAGEPAAVAGDEDAPAAAAATTAEDAGSGSSGGGSGSGVWLVSVPGESKVTFQLVFKPTKDELEQHEFLLPLSFNGHEAMPDSSLLVFTEDGSSEVRVHAHSLTPPLTASDMTIEFGERVVLLNDGGRPKQYHLNTVFSNASKERLRWDLGLDAPAVRRGLFVVAPNKGELAADQKATLRVTFSPSETRRAHAVVPVFLNGDYSQRFLELELRGAGIPPTLRFDVREVVLPVAPLEHPAQALFTIVNQGYDAVDVRHRVPPDPLFAGLRIEYPSGTKMDATRPKIPVAISFAADKPVSFTTPVWFFHAGTPEARFAVLVSGAADNSLLSLAPALAGEVRQFEVQTSRDKQLGTQFAAVPSRPPSRQQRSGETDAVAWVQADPEHHLRRQDLILALSERSVTNVVSFLNASMLKNPLADSRDFPAEFAGCPARLQELLEAVAGKRAVGVPSGGGGGSSPNLAAAAAAAAARGGAGGGAGGGTSGKGLDDSVVKRFGGLLNFLRSKGATLRGVRPEFLLTHAQFELARSAKPVLAEVPAAAFAVLSKHCWLLVLYQAVKLFSLSRITPTALRKLPTMGARPKDLPVPRSNCFGVPEITLLRWLELNSNGRRVTNFDSDLANGLVLAAVIANHCPKLRKLSGLYHSPSDKEQCGHNALCVIQTLEELGLEYSLTVKDIVEPNPVDMLLLCAYLFHNIPHFVPRSTVVFHGLLQETVRKEVTLANPSAAPISYTVSLSGSDDFKVAERVVHIEPKRAKVVTVEFTTRFSKESEARLTFFSKKRGAGTQGNVVVFLLRSQIDQLKPLKTYTYASTLYHPQELPIPIANPLAASGKFRVSARQSIALPLAKDGKPLLEKGRRLRGDAPEDYAGDLMPSFYLSFETVSLALDGKTHVTLTFVPFHMGLHTCQLRFVDSQVGEFVFEVQVVVGLPDPLEKVKFKTEERKTLRESVVLGANAPLRAAFQALAKGGFVEKLLAEAREPFAALRARVETGGLLASAATAGRTAAAAAAAATAASVGPPQRDYRLEFVGAPGFSGPKEVRVLPNDDGTARVPFSFSAKETGSHAAQMVLTSLFETRVIDVETVVSPKLNRHKLAFDGGGAGAGAIEGTVEAEAEKKEEAAAAAAEETAEAAAAPERTGAGALFRVLNPLDAPADFRAFFELGTPELAVEPAVGVMPGFAAGSATAGTEFCVVFTPAAESPAPVEDVLIIETLELRWAYKISASLS